MNKYEFVIIIDSKLSKENEKNVITRIENKIKEYANIIDKDDKGNRKLAYEIKKNKEGHFIIYTYEFEDSQKSNAVLEIERFCRITDEILKFITVKL